MKQNIRKRLIVSTLIVVSVATSQANAAIISVTGPDSSAGTAPAFIGPPSAVLDDVVTNTGMQGFDEAQGVTTTVAHAIDGGGEIPAGTVVDSHMIFLNSALPGTIISHYQVDWTFSGDIIGVMSDEPGTLEAASTFELGATGTAYPAAAFATRGMEGFQDSYVLLDSSTLRVNMRVSEPGDWIRVVTAGISCPEAAFSVFILGSDPEIEIEVYDKDGNLRHRDRSDIHFGDRIVLKATGNPFPEECEVTYKWYGEFPEGSKAELSPDNESQTSFIADKLGIYDVDLHVQSGNYITGASVQLIVNVMDLDLKFFSGDPKSKKKAKSRIKGAKYGRYGYLGEAKNAAPKDEENGFDWWKEKIESNCFIKIEYHLLPDDIETMGEYNGYSTIESTTTDKQHDRWLIGPENALSLLGPPAQTFHLAVFRSDSLWYLDDGDLVKKDHVIYDYSKDEASDLLMTRTKPYGYSQRMWIAEHEIGHLFGLTHGHGGIMSSDEDVFEGHEFFKWWCEDIIEHLNKFPVD